MVLTSRPDVADWPHVLFGPHWIFKKITEINASDKIQKPQEFAPGCPACLKDSKLLPHTFHSPLGSRCSHPPGTRHRFCVTAPPCLLSLPQALESASRRQTFPMTAVLWN